MKNRILPMSLLVFFAVSCGQEAKKAHSADDSPTATKDVSLDETLPETVVIRMPLDAFGQPTGEPEIRIVKTAADLDSAEAVSEAFATGEVPQNLTTNLDELDKNSSTQSWHWNRWGWRGGWGNGGWGNGGWWNQFNPGLGWNGNYWNYGFANNWHRGGFGYGCFNRGWW